MQEKEYTDIIPLLKHLCIVLQPLANNRNIKLDFTGTEKDIRIDCAASKLLIGFNKLFYLRYRLHARQQHTIYNDRDCCKR